MRTIVIVCMLAGVAQATPASRCTVHVAAEATVAAAMRDALSDALAIAHAEVVGAVDVAIVKVSVVDHRASIVISAELRAVVSDANGKITSIASTTAHLEIPRGRASSVTRARAQAMIEAARELAHPISRHAEVAQRQ